MAEVKVHAERRGMMEKTDLYSVLKITGKAYREHWGRNYPSAYVSRGKTHLQITYLTGDKKGETYIYNPSNSALGDSAKWLPYHDPKEDCKACELMHKNSYTEELYFLLKHSSGHTCGKIISVGGKEVK